MIPYKTNSQYAADVLSGNIDAINYIRDFKCQIYSVYEHRYIPFIHALAKDPYLFRSVLSHIINRASIIDIIAAINHSACATTNLKCLLEHFDIEKSINKEYIIEYIITEGLKYAIDTSNAEYVSFLIKTFDITKYIKHDVILDYLWSIVSRECREHLVLDNSSMFIALYETFNVSLYMLPPKSAYCYNHKTRYSILDLAILNGYPQIANLVLNESEKYNINLTYNGDYLKVCLLSALQDSANIFWSEKKLVSRLCKKVNCTEITMRNGSIRKIEN